MAKNVSKMLGLQGNVSNEPSKPGGSPQILMDVTLVHGLGSPQTTSLEEGIAGPESARKDLA